MDGLEFRKRGREMVDYIVDYLDNIDARRVTPNIEPGYLQELIPTEPPQNPEDWDTIMDDVEKKIMIGVSTAKLSSLFSKPIIKHMSLQLFKNFLISYNYSSNLMEFHSYKMSLFQMTHWQHPRFHAYFPAGNSYPSILGDMLGDAIGCVGFSWVCKKGFQNPR